MEYQTHSLTTGEAAQALSVSLKTVQQWVDRGLLQCWKTPGGHRRISPASLNALREKLGAWQPTQLRVLLVASDMQRSLACLTDLNALGMEQEIHSASDGARALVDVVRLRPDILICDLPLTGIDLKAMVSTLKQDPDLSKIQIILITDNVVQQQQVFGKHATCIDSSAGRDQLRKQLRMAIASVMMMHAST